MKLRTLTLAPGRAAPGMTLARAVVDHDGNTLLAAGTELCSETIDRLLRRRIETVSVVLADMRDEQTIADEMRAVHERVETIFRGSGSPARAALRQAVLDYRRQSAQ